MTKKMTERGPRWRPWIYLGRVSLWGSLHNTKNTQRHSKGSSDWLMLIVTRVDGGVAPYYWAMISGMLGLSDGSGGPSSPVRLLNMGSVDSGGGTPRLPAMFLSSSVFPWMVWWWYSWILQHRGTFRYFLMHKIGWKDKDKEHRALTGSSLRSFFVCRKKTQRKNSQIKRLFQSSIYSCRD